MKTPAYAGLRAVIVGLIALALTVGCGDAIAPATVVDLSGPWARATPEQAGIDPAELARAVSAAAAASRCRGLLVARHGHLVLERYFGGADSTTRFDVRSVTKSVMSALVALRSPRGSFPGFPPPSAATSGLRIRWTRATARSRWRSCSP